MAFRSGLIKDNGPFPIGKDALQPREIERQYPATPWEYRL